MGQFLRAAILTLLWTCRVIASDTNATSNLLLEFSPEQLTLIEGDTVDVMLNFWDNGTDEAFVERPWMAYPGRVTVLSDTTYNMDVINSTFEVSPCDFLEDRNFTITVRANSLGYARLQIFWEQLADTQTIFDLTSCFNDTYEHTVAERQTSDPVSEATISDQPFEDQSTEATTRPPLKKKPVLPKEDEEETHAPEDLETSMKSQDQITESPDEQETELKEKEDTEPPEEEDTEPPEEEMIAETPEVGIAEPLEEEIAEPPEEEETDLHVEEETELHEDEMIEPPEEDTTEPPEEPLDDVPIDETKSEEIEKSEDPGSDIDGASAEAAEAQNEETDSPSLDQNEMNATGEQAFESESLVYQPEPEESPHPLEDIEESVPEIPPEMPEVETPQLKKKDKPAQKFQVYKEGTTFLFKRSQELTMEEEQPTITKILLSDTYRVKILRDAGTLDIVFVIVVSMAVMVNTLMMGMQIDLNNVWAILKKPIGPAVGFFSQFAFMPLASYALGYLLLTDPNLRLGLFTLGCSPGGNGSNFWTLMLKGDLNLSITMTLISTTSALFMMPMWLFTLGQTILEDGSIGIPFTNLILSLFSFTIPVAIGVSIRRCKPAWADFAGRLIRPFTLVLIIVLLSLSIWNSLYIFRLITWQMLLAGVSIAWGGYVFGAFMAFIFRQKRPQIVAISIETAIQNPGITFMVLRLTLPQPDSDISAVAPVAQLLVTSTPLLLTYLSVMIYRKCMVCKKRKLEEQHQEDLRNDVDAIDPLLIVRSSIQPINGTAKDKSELSASATTRPDNRRETPPPPYPGVNMYTTQDYKDVEKNEQTSFGKILANKQDSIDAVPLRNTEHIYENFKNGQKIEPLRESKV